jgi:uncharacterized protein YlxP (DUF503 family)
VVVGILEVRITLRQCRSLKDKRHVVGSLKDRLRHGFNVSVAEVEGQDLHQSATLAIVQVSSDARYVRGTLERVLNMIRQRRDAQLADHRIELMHS